MYTAASFLLAFVGGTSLTAVIWYAIDIGADSVQLGILGALTTGGAMLMSFLHHLYSDPKHEKVVSIAAVSLVVVLTALTPLVSAVWLLCALYFVRSVATGAFWPSLQTLIGMNTQAHSLGKGVGSFNVAWSVGVALGALAAGLLYSINAGLTFLFPSAVGCVTVLVLVRAHAGRHAAAAHDEKVQGSVPGKVDYFLRMGWIGVFVTYFAWGNVRNLFPKFANELGISVGFQGVLFFSMLAAQTVVFFWMMNSKRWQFRLAPVAAGHVLCCAGLLIFCLFSSDAIFIIAMAAVGAGAGILYTVSIFYTLTASRGGKSKAGINEGIICLGATAGPALCGFAAKHISLRAPYYVSLLVILIGVLVQRRKKGDRHLFQQPVTPQMRKKVSVPFFNGKIREP